MDKEEYANEYNLIFVTNDNHNKSKTKCMAFLKEISSLLYVGLVVWSIVSNHLIKMVIFQFSFICNVYRFP